MHTYTKVKGTNVILNGTVFTITIVVSSYKNCQISISHISVFSPPSNLYAHSHHIYIYTISNYLSITYYTFTSFYLFSLFFLSISLPSECLVNQRPWGKCQSARRPTSGHSVTVERFLDRDEESSLFHSSLLARDFAVPSLHISLGRLDFAALTFRKIPRPRLRRCCAFCASASLARRFLFVRRWVH